ncbi:type II secretion system protein GspL [Crenobacter caeni]|uniref:GspL cytoplasmic actin-ATPase-like domain-containing protein n=1 Tax=Crenobacter caeni TaxID=2705474 RepID=A0A6B2KSY3_9NEIS|nr:type II secretion system protein GspL [Crenobacter caeni]NDV13356.1 hypothetical protein [Crenobacter caeni]
MSILRLMYRPAWPDSEMALPWVLLGERGERLDGGDDEPAAWPRTGETELVLPAGQTVFLRAALPKASRERMQAAAGYALEERLANDVQANLYALGPAAGGEHGVAVTEAFGVRRAVAMLRSLGRTPDRIVPEETLGPAEGGWQLAAAADGGRIAREGEALAWYLPAGEVGDALWARLTALSGAPQVQPAVTDAGWTAGRAASPYDFAQGELAAGRWWRTWGPALRKSGLVLALFAALQLALLLGEAGYLAWRKQQLATEIKALAVPLAGSQAVPGNSALPMLRALDRLRAERGQPVRLDGTALLARLGEVAGSTLALQQLNIEDGRVVLRAAQVPDETFARWRSQLARQGVALSRRAGEGGAQEWVLAGEP